MTERVHPTCSRECTHGLPRPPDDPAARAVPVYAGPRAHLPAEAPLSAAPRCAGCGYRGAWHEPATGKCPPETADKSGRRGQWKDAPPVDPSTWREIMRRDYLARMAAYDEAHAAYEPVVVPPPLIRARAPQGPEEIAGYQGRQAIGLGRKAAAAGWATEARYWRVHDGSEGCAVRLQKGDLYAVATWKRKAGKGGTKSGWEADIAYGVRRGDAPVKLTHTQLEGVITA